MAKWPNHFISVKLFQKRPNVMATLVCSIMRQLCDVSAPGSIVVIIKMKFSEILVVSSPRAQRSLHPKPYRPRS